NLTTWTAATATATHAEAIQMAKSLVFVPAGTEMHGTYSVDRPNLQYVVRIFQHPNSVEHFLDFSFVVPLGLTDAAQIPLTIIFADFISRGNSIMKYLQYLDGLLPSNIPNQDRLIQTYNGLVPFDQRQAICADFKAGHIRVLIVTDTATYGFDVPNVRRVILSDVSTSVANQQQQAGRTGRDGLPAEVYTFTPSWVLESTPTSASAKQVADTARRSKLPQTVVQWFNPTAEKCPRGIILEHNGEVFVRRSRCCVPVCNAATSDLEEVARWEQYFLARPTSMAHILTAPRLRSDGTFYALEKLMKESLEQMLDRWRHRIWACIRPCLEEPCEYFLPRHIMNAIVDEVHVCSSLDNLKTLAAGWEYVDTHAEQPFNFLTEILTAFQQIFTDRRAAEQPSSD
ncbi:hypothetical protein B0H16DRAFT_1850806, partial [Mycena metata]